MNKSETIGKLSLALSKAQSEMPEVKKNAQNPFLKNKYADLGAVIETSRPVLAKYELAMTQFPVSDGDKIGVTTLLAHSSGEWLEDTILISATDAKGLSFAQSAGVVISYLRRHSHGIRERHHTSHPICLRTVCPRIYLPESKYTYSAK